MKKVSITYKDVGMPTFKDIRPLDSQAINEISVTPLTQNSRGCEAYEDQDLSLFDLSSHKRARDAIEFGLKMRDKGFHVFVVGEDRSGRMTSTLSYLKQYTKTLPAPRDWVYVNNFIHNHQSKPFSFSSGMGTHFKEKLDELIENVGGILNKTLNSPQFVRHIDKLTVTAQNQVDKQIQEVQIYAKEKGYDVVQSSDGFSIDLTNTENEVIPDTSVEIQEIRDRINKMSLSAHLATQKVHKKINDFVQTTAKKVISPLFIRFHEEFTPFLGTWIGELKDDILKQAKGFHSFAEDDNVDENQKTMPQHLRERYSANVLVDNKEYPNARVMLEHNPTYENLFGSIKLMVL